ncbi:MAG: MerR family transcriptional regulator [Ignavibacteriaceae bacterium]|nr:MerR family transcriptional regulator [Ignavibacteriaceae bacterium]
MRDFNIKKLYYSISEVSKITDVEQYVLRFWENEFEQLKPQKNRAGNRIYTNKEIELIIYIKTLLKDQKYTIEGAKQVLIDFVKNKGIIPEKPKIEKTALTPLIEPEPERVDDSSTPLVKDLEDIKKFLETLKNLL